jgi:hypothetical protein
MGEILHPRLHALNRRTRAIDFAEGPALSPDGHRGLPGRLQAKASSSSRPGWNMASAFQMIPRLAILAGEPTSDPGSAMGDADLRQWASPRSR